MLALQELKGVVIDEIQRVRHLFPILRVLADRTPVPAMLRFRTMLAHWHGQIWNAAEPELDPLWSCPKIWIVHAGSKRFPLHKPLKAISLADFVMEQKVF